MRTVSSPHFPSGEYFGRHVSRATALLFEARVRLPPRRPWRVFLRRTASRRLLQFRAATMPLQVAPELAPAVNAPEACPTAIDSEARSAVDLLDNELTQVPHRS